MKIIMRAVVKVVPGKMAEYMEIDEKSKAIASRLGMPPWKRYTRVSGESMHTFVYVTEWDSLAAMEDVLDKASADPESQALEAKSDGVVESHELEYYSPLP